jgi:hypothetical protein
MNLPDSSNKILKSYPEMSIFLCHTLPDHSVGISGVADPNDLFTQNQTNSCEANFTSIVALSFDSTVVLILAAM